MSHIGTKIVAKAVSQVGKHDRVPKKNRPDEGWYFGYGRDWCSEFVSWVYNEAGTPFTGGTRKAGPCPPWLLVDTGKIRRWFKARSAYVDRNGPDWDTFMPSPGDYVFIGRVDSSRKHSGLVERVVEDTLCTIEGNNNGRPVARYVYPRFRTNIISNNPPDTNGYVRGFGAISGKRSNAGKSVSGMYKSGVNFGYVPNKGGPRKLPRPICLGRRAEIQLYVERAIWRELDSIDR